ncbi:hypothetical protein MUP37_06370 [Candidatus Bathyarchaeota archaeon]|nr:hypothetical protein [Candidatus Bathyarchaeota archaeon]
MTKHLKNCSNIHLVAIVVGKSLTEVEDKIGSSVIKSIQKSAQIIAYSNKRGSVAALRQCFAYFFHHLIMFQHSFNAVFPE